jgi:hypothetical protein
MQRTTLRETRTPGWGIVPKKIGDTMVNEYQRRTLTGTGRLTKTVRSCTAKTPRTIVITLCATTSASIMVRFFCISNVNMLLIQMLLTPQRKTFFTMWGDFYCKIFAKYVKTREQAFVCASGEPPGIEPGRLLSTQSNSGLR